MAHRFSQHPVRARVGRTVPFEYDLRFLLPKKPWAGRSAAKLAGAEVGDVVRPQVLVPLRSRAEAGGDDESARTAIEHLHHDVPRRARPAPEVLDHQQARPEDPAEPAAE